jgi:Glycosyl transferase family group 2
MRAHSDEENPKVVRSGHGGVEVAYDNSKASNGGKNGYANLKAKGTGAGNGPVDIDALDDLFRRDRPEDDDDNSFFGSEEDYDSDDEMQDELKRLYFQNPNELLDKDATNIPGSPWAKPATRKSNRPSEPLPIAKYASSISFILAVGWVVFLLVMAIWNHDNVGRIIVEIFLALLSFFGLFWNSYFTVASILKCFIPANAFKQNTKYFSMIPEAKQPGDEWLDVTIQIPVYKESLQDVLMPTLKSCMKARDHYIGNSQAMCNIVVCDDGIMNYLNDNFPAAEMLWENVVETKGKVVRLSQILKRIPRVARRHLKGLRSKNIYEVFHRMLFYYHFQIGWVSRSTIDRRGKFKKASNLNTHLRLNFGAEDLSRSSGKSFEDCLLTVAHSDDGARYIMFGNNVRIGHLICVNDADARMQAPVIFKTVPEFLNDQRLGFTQHATKTLDDQRGESFYLRMIAAYTDALYQGHFLLSSILGCHPPLVGHSIFIRSEAIKQCGRMRNLRNAQRWLKNIGLPFLSVDQVGFKNLHGGLRSEYWSETHVSEDFELMIHLYNIGYNGRYIAYPGCEFQEGVTRTFDEEAGRHRKFALGAHELVFNPFQEMLGHGIFTPLFKTFITCDIPAYYKIFLTAYLFSYTGGGTYIIVFTIASIARMLDSGDIKTLYAFSPAGIIVLNVLVYYIIGFSCFLIALLRMHWINKDLFFPEYRRSKCYLIFQQTWYALRFQMMFYTAMGNYFFLGSMDHLMSRPNICGATNKDSIEQSRCVALWETIKFNTGSWWISFLMLLLAYATVLQEYDWNVTTMPDWSEWNDPESTLFAALLFAAPAAFFSIMSFIVPIIMNPFVLGWPFYWKRREAKPKAKKSVSRRFKAPQDAEIGTNKVTVDSFMHTEAQLQREIERNQGRPDMELGSLATNDLTRTQSHSKRDVKNVGDSYNPPGTYNLGGQRIIDRTSRDQPRPQHNQTRPNKGSKPNAKAGFAI